MVIHLAAVVGLGQSMYEIVRYVDANTLGTARLLQLIAKGALTTCVRAAALGANEIGCALPNIKPAIRNATMSSSLRIVQTF